MNSKGFWKNLPRPFSSLAPMAEVTDQAFRQMFVKHGKPDVLWTEFVSADGLCSPGRKHLLRDLAFQKNEHPIVAQIFGATPDHFKEATSLVAELGFDGLDINMGCPDKKVEKQNAGAALIKNPKLAQEIIHAAKEGAGKMPVSIKTRVGWNSESLDDWLPYLLETEPAAITIHARTRKEMSKVPANWELISKARVMIDKYFSNPKDRPLLIGNGDIVSLQDGIEKAAQYGTDGFMVGRGTFGNPWFFNQEKQNVSIEEKLRALLEHTELFEKLYITGQQKPKNFDIMKKHYKAYVTGFDGAKELRIKLMGTKNLSEVKKLI